MRAFICALPVFVVLRIAAQSDVVALSVLRPPQLGAQLLGYSAAADGGRLVVGRPSTVPAGAVDVFDVTGTTAVLTATLVPANLFPSGAAFGAAVGIAGNRIAVGAQNATLNGVSSGVVVIFLRDPVSTAWSVEAVIVPQPATPCSFGHSLAFDGARLLIGAPIRSVPGIQAAGAVFDFRRSGSGWTQFAEIASSTPSTMERFGWSVAAESATLVVGIENGVVGPIRPGAIEVFSSLASGWVSLGRPSRPGAQAGEQFGGAVAIQGTTIAVGSTLRDSPGVTNSGAVTTFDFDPVGGSWQYGATLLVPNPAAEDRFGISVLLERGHVVAGAAEAQQDTGFIASFSRAATGLWVFNEAFFGLTPSPRRFFGRSIAHTAGALFVGAPDTSVGNDTGVVHVCCVGSGSARTFGNGLGGTGGLIPRLATTACVVIGGAVTLRVGDALTNALGVFVLGYARTAVPIMGGTLLVVPVVTDFRIVDTAGTARHDIVIPMDGALIGLGVVAQFGVLDAGAPQGLAHSKGLAMVVGRSW